MKYKIYVLFLLLSFKAVQAQEFKTFKDKNPLFLVDIGNAKLATRYKKGIGIPIIFVHGSWGDHNHWLPIVSKLSKKIKNPIIIYDRRGHSVSTPDKKQGSIEEDVNDLVLLTQKLGFKKGYYVGHSYGSNIIIKLANEYPKFIKKMIVYEPPIFGLLKGKQEYKEIAIKAKKDMLFAKKMLENGEVEKGTIQFMENVAFGKGSWLTMFDEASRLSMLSNYRTWLDQFYDVKRLTINPKKLNNLKKGQVTIINGKLSLPVFKCVTKELNKVVHKKTIIELNAGHGGIFTNADEITKIISDLCD